MISFKFVYLLLFLCVISNNQLVKAPDNNSYPAVGDSHEVYSTTKNLLYTVKDPDGNSYSVVGDSRGLHWITKNLLYTVKDSYCYDNDLRNCVTHGRLYTRKAALKACRSLGNGWKLPDESDWQWLLNMYGGFFDRSLGIGKVTPHFGNPTETFKAMVSGGKSKMDITLGGIGIKKDKHFDYLDRWGTYWSSSTNPPFWIGQNNKQAVVFQFKNKQVIKDYWDMEGKNLLSCRCVKKK